MRKVLEDRKLEELYLVMRMVFGRWGNYIVCHSP